MPSYRNYRDISYYDVSGHQLEHIDSAQAHTLCADGSHEWRCVSCGQAKGEGRCPTAINHTMAVFAVDQVLEDDNGRKGGHESDCSLTDRDMRRNVGITEGFPGEPAVMSLIRRARARIRYWGEASKNNRAVTIVPGKALRGM